MRSHTASATAREAREDVEVQAGIAHLHRHDAALGGPVHDELQRQAKRLQPYERRERQAAREAVAHSGSRDDRAEHQDAEKHADERRRA